METNLYAPPVAAVAELSDAGETPAKPFYVVGLLKFLLLFFLSFGLFQLVMYYLHWSRFKRATKTPMWPVARAIFPVFFLHSLAEEIDHRLHRAGIRHDWSPKLAATVIVVLLIANRIADRFLDQMTSDVAVLGFGWASLLVIAWFLWQIQSAANLACGEPDGDSNRRLTLVNWLWIVPLAIFWLLVIAGLALPDSA
jgi:hypothetical protein